MNALRHLLRRLFGDRTTRRRYWPGRAQLAHDWAAALLLLVAFPVLTGGVFHAAYGTFPGAVMFAAVAGFGLFVSLARVGRGVRR